MGKITAIEIQQKRKNRFNIYVDGEFAFGVDRFAAVGLRIGQELTQDQINTILLEDEYETAKGRALNLLSHRPRSAKEVRANLIKHKTSEGNIERVIARLQEVDLLNDDNFAQLWVDNRNEFRPRGQHLLRNELRQKGISDDTIESILTNQPEEVLALAAARKKARRLHGLEKFDFKKKMYGFLARRGFGHDTIPTVIDQVWEESTAEDPASPA